MAKELKTEQLQIRLSLSEKQQIIQAAKKANLSISEFVLNALTSKSKQTFQNCLREISKGKNSSIAYASLNDFLNSLSSEEFSLATSEPPSSKLSEEDSNYIAAMVEHAAIQKGSLIPDWTKQIEIPKQPYFGSQIKKLRQQLLLTSPVAFRRRNIFIDSTLGDRV